MSERTQMGETAKTKTNVRRADTVETGGWSKLDESEPPHRELTHLDINDE